MTNLIGKLCAAIAQQEGWNAPTSAGATPNLPQRNRNPGDLRAAPWLAHATIVNGYWVADSVAQGIAGLYYQVALNVARGYSLRKLITAWAPASDGNDPQSYLAHVMTWTGIQNADQPLQELLELTKPT